jgi:phage tail tape-measure protein
VFSGVGLGSIVGVAVGSTVGVALGFAVGEAVGSTVGVAAGSTADVSTTLETAVGALVSGVDVAPQAVANNDSNTINDKFRMPLFIFLPPYFRFTV